MFDEAKMLELAQAEDMAYFKGDLVLSLPKGSYTVEEMWEVVKAFRVRGYQNGLLLKSSQFVRMDERLYPAPV